MCFNVDASLFIFGHSFDENDEHFLSMIREGRFKRVFVGVHKENGKYNRKIIERAKGLNHDRNKVYPLDVVLFDTTTENIWGKNGNA